MSVNKADCEFGVRHLKPSNMEALRDSLREQLAAFKAMSRPVFSEEGRVLWTRANIVRRENALYKEVVNS